MQIQRDLFDSALRYTKQRLEANKPYYSVATHKRRDGKRNSVLFPKKVDGNMLTDFKGILAEMVAREMLDLSGHNYFASAFVKSRGSSDPDIIVNGIRFDVKGCEKTMKVNKKTFESNNDVDEYVFVTFTSDKECVIERHTKDQIKRWQLKSINKWNEWYENRPGSS